MKCLIDKCGKDAAVSCRGLCMKCYSSAKKAVEAKTVTWEQLEAMSLAMAKDSTPFDEAFKAAIKPPGYQEK